MWKIALCLVAFQVILAQEAGEIRKLPYERTKEI